MPFYRVRDGHQLGHCGRTLTAGDVLEIPEHVAAEVAGLVEPCTAEGVSLAHLTADELELARALPHERDSVRRAHAARGGAPAPPPAPVATTKTGSTTRSPGRTATVEKDDADA
jgi:hypothetical protein